jgi:uroporphyrinogen III methyltransferase/synthase
MTGRGRVCIIGAGPGDPGLISARGIRLLAEADVVVYDRAVESVLRWARPEAERIAAGAPAERERAQDAISMLVAEKAREGHVVARLKWGDAFVFDSGAKEALFLHEQGIPFEVVPGIPAAIGVPAYAGVPVTYPGAGDALLLVRGHEGETDALPEVDWAAAARLDGTLVCYAAGRQVPAMLRALIDHGAQPDRLAALIYDGTRPGQRTVTGTIGELVDAAPPAAATAAIMVVSKAVGLREHLRWFDARPLFGRRIVVARAREHTSDLVERLEHLGADAIEMPAFRIGPPEDPEAVDRAAASVDGYRWIVFESGTAVNRLVAALTRGPQDLRALGGTLICAVGAQTVERLSAAGLKADVIVPEFRSETVIEQLIARSGLSGQRVLLVRPDHPRDPLVEDLAQHGAVVTDLVAYKLTADSTDSPSVQNVYRMLLDRRIDAVAFTSPTAVRLFVSLIGEEQAADLLEQTIVAAIGPVTAAAAGELGITASVVPETFTTEALAAALVARFHTQEMPE